MRSPRNSVYVWNVRQEDLLGRISHYLQHLTATPNGIAQPTIIYIDPGYDPFAVVEFGRGEYSMINIIQSCPHHTFYCVTQCPEQAEQLLQSLYLPNLWIGVIVTNQAEALAGIPPLLRLHCHRFVVCQQMTSPITLMRWLKSIPVFQPDFPSSTEPYQACKDLPALPGIDEVWLQPVVGGEQCPAVRLLQHECHIAKITYRMLPAPQAIHRQPVI